MHENVGAQLYNLPGVLESDIHLMKSQKQFLYDGCLLKLCSKKRNELTITTGSYIVDSQCNLQMKNKKTAINDFFVHYIQYMYLLKFKKNVRLTCHTAYNN